MPSSDSNLESSAKETSLELKAFLQGVYPDYEIEVEEDEEGNFVYTANGIELATVDKEDVGEVYANLTSGLDTSNKEADPSKVTKAGSGKRRNYGTKKLISIDLDLFDSIVATIANGISSLSNVKDVDSSCLTGELASYFDGYLSTFGMGSINSLISEAKTSAGDLAFKVDASIKAYQEIDDELRFGLNIVFANIFNMSSTDIATYNMTAEEREAYIDGLISNYTDILTDFKEEYKELMGAGIDLDANSFYLWTSMINFFPVLDDKATDLTLHMYLPNGMIDLNQLDYYATAWENSGIKDKLLLYIREGKSWEESGLSMYDTDLCHRSEYDFLFSIGSRVENTEEFLDYKRNHGYDWDDLLIDSQNRDAYDKTALLKFIDESGVFDLSSNYQEVLNRKHQLESDILTLDNTIYNLNQYKGLLRYEDMANDPKYSLYLAGDLSFALTDPNLKKGELYNYMDASEVALYKLILDTKGESEAKGYLNALTDTINQRKGFEVAATFCQNMNQNGGYLLDFLYSGAVGFGDGVENFFSGLGNFFGGADGVRSIQDYEHMFKVQLLGSNNEYTNNLSDAYRTCLGFQYQAFTSVGQNAIPMLLNFTPIPGAKTLGTSLMFMSSAGNATEGALQDGATKGRAYLYGMLSGASEVLFEKVLGHLPGIGKSSAALGTETLFESMIGEAKEEIFQTYFDGALRSTILGEPFDLGALTEESLQAGLTAMYCAGISNVGAKCLIKIGDKVVDLSTHGEQKSYLEWCRSATLSIANTVGLDLKMDNTGIHMPPSDNTMDIDSIEYNDESQNYVIKTKSGQIFTVDDINRFRSQISNIPVGNMDLCATGAMCALGPVAELTLHQGAQDVTSAMLEHVDSSPFLQQYGDRVKVDLVFKGFDSYYLIKFDSGLTVKTDNVLKFDYGKIAEADQLYYNAHGSDQQWLSHMNPGRGGLPQSVKDIYKHYFPNLDPTQKSIILRGQDSGSCTLATLTDAFAQHMIQNGGIESYQQYFSFPLRNSDGSINTTAIIAELGACAEYNICDKYSQQGNMKTVKNRDGSTKVLYTGLLRTPNGYVFNPACSGSSILSGTTQTPTDMNNVMNMFLSNHGIPEAMDALVRPINNDFSVIINDPNIADGSDKFLALGMRGREANVDYLVFNPSNGVSTQSQRLKGGHCTLVNTNLTRGMGAEGVVVNTWTGEAFLSGDSIRSTVGLKNNISEMFWLRFTRK